MTGSSQIARVDQIESVPGEVQSIRGPMVRQYRIEELTHLTSAAWPVRSVTPSFAGDRRHTHRSQMPARTGGLGRSTLSCYMESRPNPPSRSRVAGTAFSRTVSSSFRVLTTSVLAVAPNHSVVSLPRLVYLLGVPAWMLFVSTYCSEFSAVKGAFPPSSPCFVAGSRASETVIRDDWIPARRGESTTNGAGISRRRLTVVWYQQTGASARLLRRFAFLRDPPHE